MNGEGVRRRIIPAQGQSTDQESGHFLRSRQLPVATWRLGYLHWSLILAFILTVIYVSRYVSSQLPQPWPSSEHGDTRDWSKFSEDRARQHLLVLTSFRPRTVGTDGNDKFAVRYFLKEAEGIKKKAQPFNKIDIDHQVVSGSFQLKFLGGFNNVYQDVHNVLVRIGPLHAESNRTLLINCHFDAAIGVDGASDDLSQCVTMLEAFTVLSQRSSLPCNILFLFNGAEESILQASHGFVTQHPWAKDVTAFINLEAAGSGGRDALFQSGPKHPWLVRAYARVPHPCGNSLGEEIFQSGVIPSDTDFRIFRDHGQLPGVDIAYVENGYVYHTHYDRVEQITSGTLQRSGENLLALLYGIITSPEFYNLEDCEECNSDSAVYFDFLGLAFVMYSHFTGVVINYLFAAVTLAMAFLEIKRELSASRDVSPAIRKHKILLAGLSLVVLSFVLPVIVSGAVGLGVSLLAPLSWFSKPILAFFLYSCPAIATLMCLHVAFASIPLMAALPASLRECISYHFVALVWVVVLVGMTFKGLNSAFLILFFVAPPVPIRFICFAFQPLTRRDISAFLMAHMTAVAVCVIPVLYFLLSAVEVFIPIFGRTGSELNPDVALGALVAIVTVCVASYYTSLIQVTKRRVAEGIGKAALLLCAVAVACVSLTPLGFPYSAPPNRMAPKRMAIQHLHRETFDVSGKRVTNEDGLWVVPLDYTGIDPVADVFNFSHITPPDCNKLLYCGLPFIYPMMEVLKHHIFIPVNETAELPHQPVIEKLSQQLLSENVQRLTFTANLVDHSNVYISPVSSCQLVEWNLTVAEPMEGPKWNNRSTYFIFLVSGYNPMRDIFEKVFWIDLKCQERLPNPSGIVEIGIVNHFLIKSSPLLDRLVEQLPDWVSTIKWLNALHLHTF